MLIIREERSQQKEKGTVQRRSRETAMEFHVSVFHKRDWSTLLHAEKITGRNEV